MTKEFENLLNLLKSGISENVMLGLQVAQNYESEFEAYFGCFSEQYEELYSFLKKNGFKVEGIVEGLLTDLVELDMSRNNLTEIPKSIGILKKLEVLDIYKNKIKELPLEYV